ncbi:MAG: hypothetical protein PGN12_01430 [Sphingomonas phyllosphaerae]
MRIVHLYKSLIDTVVAWGGSAALLHVHVGMAIYLAVLLMVRQRRAGSVALQVVLAAELGNEVMDWLNASPDWTWSDTASDVALTLLWPVAITAVLAWRRRRWRKSGATMARSDAISLRAKGHVPIAST